MASANQHLQQSIDWLLPQSTDSNAKHSSRCSISTIFPLNFHKGKHFFFLAAVFLKQTKGK